MNAINTLNVPRFVTQRPSDPRVRAGYGRRLLVVDIENLVGGARLTAHQVGWTKSVLTSTLGITAPDQVVVGTSHIGLLEAACGWPSIRYVVRSGPDGADLALLDVLDENVAQRFEHVVVASGDGAFTGAVAALGDAGVSTTVVAQRDKLARTLRMAASRVLYLPAPPPRPGLAATA